MPVRMRPPEAALSLVPSGAIEKGSFHPQPRKWPEPSFTTTLILGFSASSMRRKRLPCFIGHAACGVPLQPPRQTEARFCHSSGGAVLVAKVTSTPSNPQDNVPIACTKYSMLQLVTHRGLQPRCFGQRWPATGVVMRALCSEPRMQ